MRRWGVSGAAAVMGVVFGAGALAAGHPVQALLLLVAFGAVALIMSPWAFPRAKSAADAQASSAADGRPIVYWRPGCPFCLRLRASLGSDAAKLNWVDIWADPDGAAAVRAVTGGDETVPTVVAGGESWVNPAPAKVRELVRSAA